MGRVAHAESSDPATSPPKKFETCTDCEEVPERHFQVEKSALVKSPGEHLKISVNQIFVTYVLSY